ncbi:dual specificity protein phosphatase family protein [Wielerella bovis]|uniref:dual specificity protein phosphatase family protein n=1 Tax=Wielerella bovis TaxID=2917790 RepID=UPI00201909E7|nr:dual specificity protein phosphatase family protein [Wielerella bovis]ULJ62489.1 dual specificity protein phosphatase family protein [Wielerella bovis]
MKPTFSQSLFKLILTAALFYASYGFANWLTAQRDFVPEIIFHWEHNLPFWAWTIVPYWSLNILYGLGFFLCHNHAEQNRYLMQLIAAQSIAIICFILFPLHISWQKPPTDGLTGQLFASLATFDQPYNQAPSLHIILTIVVGYFYWRRLGAIDNSFRGCFFVKITNFCVKNTRQWTALAHIFSLNLAILPEKPTPRPNCQQPLVSLKKHRTTIRSVWLIWCALIALSVLTTYQHHFIDIPTGALVGLLIVWALPYERRSPLVHRVIHTPKHTRWAMLYFMLVIVSGCLAYVINGAGLWLFWGSVSCLLMGLAYAKFGANLLQKQNNGRHTFAATCLFAPQILAAKLNQIIWLRHDTESEHIAENIFIGSLKALKNPNFQAALDVCAELPACRTPANYVALPMLDMVSPTVAQLAQAAAHLDRLHHQQQTVLVCCALGYGRSAAVILAWLMLYRAYDWDEAVALLHTARPKAVISADVRAAIEALRFQAYY